MKEVLLIGMGPGDPRQVTYEAVEAMRRTSVFFVLDKGLAKGELMQMRKAVLERYLEPGSYRLVQVEDPWRDTQAVDYAGAVREWHEQRAVLYARLLEDHVGANETGAFLLWGEPSLYDGTLRILERVRQRGMSLQLSVIPGISSVQALAARHRIPLNRIGEPLTIVPGRRLAEQQRINNAVVMLDGHCAFAELDDPDLSIYWGAYLGTPDEILIAGPLHAVKLQILEARETARRRKGWIMDAYLLRRPSPED